MPVKFSCALKCPQRAKSSGEPAPPTGNRWPLLQHMTGYPCSSSSWKVHVIRLQRKQKVTESFPASVRYARMWKQAEPTQLRRLARSKISWDCIMEALMQKVCSRLFQPSGVFQAATSRVAAGLCVVTYIKFRTAARSNISDGLAASLSCGRLHGRRIPKPRLVLLYGPAALKLAGNISDGLMVPHPTSRIKADHYLLPGQPGTVCKYFIQLSLAGGWKPLQHSMLLDSQALGAASDTLHWHNIPLSGAIEAGR